MEHILEVQDLNIALKEHGKEYPAVDHLRLQIPKGKTIGIIGESGSGKSISCQAILGLLEEKKWNYTGKVLLDGKEVNIHDTEEARKMRGAKIAMILQNPISAFDPTMRIKNHFLETMHAHKDMTTPEILTQAKKMLQRLHIQNPDRVLSSYPFQCSGGMLQRIMIAIAMMLEPEIMIADEPTTALDRTIQHEIVRLLQELKQKTGMSMIIVSHDLGVMEHLADEIYVMYSGQLVEHASMNEIIKNPGHPYTKGLIGSRPIYSKERLKVMEGNPPILKMRIEGCQFQPRCTICTDDCNTWKPVVYDGRPEHFVSCCEIQKKMRLSPEVSTAMEGASV